MYIQIHNQMAFDIFIFTHSDTVFYVAMKREKLIE